MNGTVLLILSCLPLVAETGFFVVIAKFFAKKLKDHFSIPGKIVDELKDVKSEIRKLNSRNYDLSKENKELTQKVENLTMQLKGFRDYGEVKKD